MGKQRFNRHQKKPYHNNNEHRRNFHNNRKPNSEGFVKRDRQNFTPRDSLKENQVGITEYVSKGEGFMGVLKSRFSDFQVNEIDLSGKVLQLDDLTIPEQDADVLSPEEFENARESIKDIINEDVWLQIKQLAEAKNGNAFRPGDETIYVDVTELDKDKRTHAHKIIKQLYAGKLVSSTVAGDQLGKGEETKFIRVMKPKGRDRNRWSFPGEYVHFLVHKENLDTSEVAAAMANKMNLRPSQVNYCGTKDKRAKTTQKFCIKKRTPRQIVGSIKQIYGVKVGNFNFKHEVLKLGQLRGNRFRIALRHLTGDQEKIETSLRNIKENGFINYFGLQRFGNCSSVPTYEIGVALLRADYKLACELILKPRDNDLPFLKTIREMWWKDRNSKAAVAMFRSDRFIEKKLLDGLAQYGEHDYSASLRKIPRNMLSLYTHAFQSLVFNNMASRRIKEFGLKLIPGDLVYRNREEDDADIEITELVTEDGEEQSHPEYASKENEDATEPTEKEEASTPNKPEETSIHTETEETAENTEHKESHFKRLVKALTEEDIRSGDYSIFDVVLPLPGYDITYPDNEVSKWYENMMAEYDLTSEKLRHNVKTYALAGAYRKMLRKPKDMSWELCSYATPEQTLILSDFELLKGKTLEESSDNKYEALLLDFCLPTSSYATMMLRELLKSDTSASFQTSLGIAALNEDKTTEVEATTPQEEENAKENKQNDKAEEEEKETKTEKRSASEIEDTGTDAKPAKVAKNTEEE